MKAAKISKRAFLTSAGVGSAALASYGGLVEAKWLDLGQHEIKTNRTGEPIKILHLGDLHASWCVSLSFIQEALERGLQLKPDLILVTGDFITTRFDDLNGYCDVLSRLNKAAPVYACLGNHDGGHWAIRHGGHENSDWVRNLLRQSRIDLLHNRSVDIQVKDRAIRLVGVGDLYSREAQPAHAFPAATTAAPSYTILLAHNPDTKDVLATYPWDLMLSGHTHGGQFFLPVIGAPFAPVIDKRFIAGIYAWQNRVIHITKGVGNVYGLRFNCRPEISLLTLV